MTKLTMRRFLKTIILVSIVFGGSHSFAQNKKVLLAGASTSNITPYLGGGIVGNFGIPPAAEYIHDELHARTLVLDNEENRIVFVVLDNISIAREVLDEV